MNAIHGNKLERAKENNGKCSKCHEGPKSDLSIACRSFEGINYM